MADIITEPAVPDTPAKPDTLPFVEPVAPSDTQDAGADKAPTADSDKTDGADSSIAPATSAAGAADAAPVPVSSAEKEEGTKAADKAGQHVRDSTVPTHPKGIA
ncbi:MAG: hypothetical protein STHCBS139747_001115 [Sporothrix thermara]